MLYDGSPDLAVEILSPSNTIPEINQKLWSILTAAASRYGLSTSVPVHSPSTAGMRLRKPSPTATPCPAPMPCRDSVARSPPCCRPTTRPATPFVPASPHRAALSSLSGCGTTKTGSSKDQPLRRFPPARGQQQLYFLISGTVVSIQIAPPPHIGIDRYLHRLAGSTSPAQHVKDGPASLGPDEPRGLRRNFQLSCHIDISLPFHPLILSLSKDHPKPVEEPPLPRWERAEPLTPPIITHYAHQSPPDAPARPHPAVARYSGSGTWRWLLSDPGLPALATPVARDIGPP